MKIESIKELKALIKLCRQLGVDAIEVDNVKFGLGPEPVKYKIQKVSTKQETQVIMEAGGITEEVTIPTNGLTEEQLLYYSAQGHSEQQ